ncbi:MAG TPA: polyprenol monophosphomannose synthase [Candidatus Limnocylindria bacterium]|nr:polyprenol monophosphomannose synthase [Candidatus Limnocylindria bacterium]
MRLLVVIPTYNEALNLPHLVPRIRAVKPDADVLVVDDGSPDGTADVARQLGVGVLERSSKAGRGGAVMAGLRDGLARGGYDAFLEMDADLSHQPEELPRFLDAFGGADMVIGSRYLPGAGIEGWSWRRKVWSRMSNRMIRVVLGVPLTDFTNGYRLYSPRAVEHLAAAPLRETGYISLSEWAYALHAAGLPIVEVPTLFINRRLGTSNMSASEALNALRGLVRMRRRMPAARGHAERTA